MTHANPHLWWYTARAAGLVAWWTATASVLWGLALSGRLVRRRGAPAWLLGMHRVLGGLSVILTGVHVAALVADSYVRFAWADVFVPFASKWHPAAVAPGVFAMYILVIVESTSLLMRRLPRRLWRAIHASAFMVFALGTVHAFTAGTERTNVAVQWTGLVAAVLFTFVALYRQLARRSKAATARSGRVGESRRPGSVTARERVDVEDRAGRTVARRRDGAGVEERGHQAHGRRAPGRLAERHPQRA